MDIVLSYRFTGEDPAELGPFLEKICATLRGNGHKVLCSYEQQNSYEERKLTPDQIYKEFLTQMFGYDMLLSVVRSPKKSTGMRYEADHAKLLDMRRVLAIKENVEHEFLSEFPRVIRYRDIDDLCSKLKEQFP